MNAQAILRILAKVQGVVSIEAGIAQTPDGTSLDLEGALEQSLSTAEMEAISGRYSDGPWGLEATPSSDPYNIRIINDVDGNKIAIVANPAHQKKEESLANARLMAASPALLSALAKTVAELRKLQKTQGGVNPEVLIAAEKAVEAAL